jgi:hypothetical protein
MTRQNPDANDLLFGNAIPAVAFDKGTVVRFRVVDQSSIHRREVKYNADTNRYEQGDFLYWDGKKPVTYETDRKVLDPVITVQTTFLKWEAVSDQTKKVGADDGMRRIVIKGRKAEGSIMDAVRKACEVAGVRKIAAGQYGEISCTGEGKALRKGMNAPKLYAAVWHLEAPEWADQVPSGDASTGDDTDDDDSPFN